MTGPTKGAFGVIMHGRAFTDEAIEWFTGSPAYHAFICIDPRTVIEARPAGAGYAEIYIGPNVAWSQMPLTDAQRGAIVSAALAKKGVKYSWLDDAAIGITKLMERRLPGWRIPWAIRHRLSRPDRLMCSQLVDTVYRQAGIQLFQDGRWPGDVSPGDLYDLITAQVKQPA